MTIWSQRMRQKRNHGPRVTQIMKSFGTNNVKCCEFFEPIILIMFYSPLLKHTFDAFALPKILLVHLCYVIYLDPWCRIFLGYIQVSLPRLIFTVRSCNITTWRKRREITRQNENILLNESLNCLKIVCSTRSLA